jgi:hypothetical protein
MHLFLCPLPIYKGLDLVSNFIFHVMQKKNSFIHFFFTSNSLIYHLNKLHYICVCKLEIRIIKFIFY